MCRSNPALVPRDILDFCNGKARARTGADDSVVGDSGCGGGGWGETELNSLQASTGSFMFSKSSTLSGVK